MKTTILAFGKPLLFKCTPAVPYGGDAYRRWLSAYHTEGEFNSVTIAHESPCSNCDWPVPHD